MRYSIISCKDNKLQTYTKKHTVLGSLKLGFKKKRCLAQGRDLKMWLWWYTICTTREAVQAKAWGIGIKRYNQAIGLEESRQISEGVNWYCITKGQPHQV